MGSDIEKALEAIRPKRTDYGGDGSTYSLVHRVAEALRKEREAAIADQEANLALMHALCAAWIRKQSEQYPVDAFPEPPSGGHGETVDECTARAARYFSKVWADTLDVLELSEPIDGG